MQQSGLLPAWSVCLNLPGSSQRCYQAPVAAVTAAMSSLHVGTATHSACCQLMQAGVPDLLLKLKAPSMHVTCRALVSSSTAASEPGARLSCMPALASSRCSSSSRSPANAASSSGEQENRVELTVLACKKVLGSSKIGS